MVYMTYLNAKILIHPAQKAQIALLIIEKVTVLAKYPDFANFF